MFRSLLSHLQGKINVYMHDVQNAVSYETWILSTLVGASHIRKTAPARARSQTAHSGSRDLMVDLPTMATRQPIAE